MRSNRPTRVNHQSSKFDLDIVLWGQLILPRSTEFPDGFFSRVRCNLSTRGFDLHWEFWVGFSWLGYGVCHWSLSPQQHSILDIWVMSYSDQPFKPNVPVQQRQKEPDCNFYFIILYKCTLQPAACIENRLKGLKGCWNWELISCMLLCRLCLSDEVCKKRA